jgi:uncharacterized protein
MTHSPVRHDSHHSHGPIAPLPSHRARRESRFGLFAPTDGSRAPFRVLVSLRWIVAGLAGVSIWLGALAATSPRRRLTLLGGTAGAALAAIGSALLGASRLRFEQIELPVRDLPRDLDGFRIVQISDMHLGWPFTARHVRRAVDWAIARQTDLIALTGDFIASDLDLDLLRASLRGIRARHGVFAVLGNHDYWTDTHEIERELLSHGVTLLRNESRLITVGESRLRIVGVDCVWEGLHDLDAALNGCARDETVVVLAHEPDVADEIAPRGAVLQLSGHTHAGHFALPWLGPAFLPRHGFRYFRGLQRVGEMWVYVSRGIGGYPLRLGSSPEVTELTLRRG